MLAFISKPAQHNTQTSEKAEQNSFSDPSVKERDGTAHLPLT